jgi:hypothetical protein
MVSIFCFSMVFMIWQHVRMNCISSSDKGFSPLSRASVPSLLHFPWDPSCLFYGCLVSADQGSQERGIPGSLPLTCPISLSTQTRVYFYKLSDVLLVTCIFPNDLPLILFPLHLFPRISSSSTLTGCNWLRFTFL